MYIYIITFLWKISDQKTESPRENAINIIYQYNIQLLDKNSTVAINNIIINMIRNDKNKLTNKIVRSYFRCVYICIYRMD